MKIYNKNYVYNKVVSSNTFAEYMTVVQLTHVAYITLMTVMSIEDNFVDFTPVTEVF